MPISIRIEFPQREYLRLLEIIDAKTVHRAETQALKRTAGNAIQFGITLLANEMGIAKSKLSRRGRKLDYRGQGKHGRWNIIRKATIRRARVDLEGAGRPFNVTRFNAQPIRMGASTSIDGRKRRGKGRVLGVTHNAWGQQQTVTPAWQLRNGAYVLPSGNSFRGIYGPGVVKELRRRKLFRKLENHSQERFTHHFSQAIEYWWGRGL